jgi:hypothetical protein
MQSEAQFKKAIIDSWKVEKVFDYIFCIETEETEKGFPDVMVKLRDMEVYKFFEFKVSDSKGRIKFTRNQPSFYALHERMDIKIVALDNRTNDTFYCFDSRLIFDDKSEFQLVENTLEVQLP